MDVFSLMNVVCCQVEVSATGRSLVQSFTDCGVSLYVIYKPQEGGGPGPMWAVVPERKNYINTLVTLSQAAGVSPNPNIS
jgi:hypothetical protein